MGDYGCVALENMLTEAGRNTPDSYFAIGRSGGSNYNRIVDQHGYDTAVMTMELSHK